MIFLVSILFAVTLASGPQAAALAQTPFNITEQQEIEIGKRAAIEIEIDFPMVDDRTIERYINRLGQRLVRESGRNHISYRFRVINSDEINAFALPGGFIYINRGLIEAADTESELAGVIAHEIAHIVARHHVNQIRRAKLTDLGVGALGPIFGRGVKALLIRGAGEVVAAGISMKHSREDEREADRLGAKNLYDAGYDPRGMVSFHEKLGAIDVARPGFLQAFFASHPSPEERMDNVSDLIAVLSTEKELRSDSDEFQRVKRRLQRLYPPKPRSDSDEPVPLQLHQTGEVELDDLEREREVAATFAPVFHQGLGDEPRYDYITNFDFDGDWQGDNNWENAADSRFPLKAWIYYAVRETETHFFIHYAAFHPRDYKGGTRRGSIFSRLIRRGVRKASQVDPTGRAAELVLAHENDLEGCLVVVEKQGRDPRNGRVVFVETLAHNKFYKYVTDQSKHGGFESITLKGRRPELFIEPRGHGIEAFRGDEEQLADCTNGVLVYTFTGHAGEPKKTHAPTGYDLVPIATTLWPPALRGLTPTYAETHDYGVLFFDIKRPNGDVAEVHFEIGRIGSAFRGTVGASNLARPPWGWFDGGEGAPLGEWFFDPARTVKRHFNPGDEFSTVYLGPGLLDQNIRNP